MGLNGYCPLGETRKTDRDGKGEGRFHEVNLDYLMLCEGVPDPNAEEVQTNFWSELPPGHLCPLTHPEAVRWEASPPTREPPEPPLGKGLAKFGHRDGYSPTGRSSGRVTAVMLGRNVGATLAVTVGTQSSGTCGHHCRA